MIMKHDEGMVGCLSDLCKGSSPLEKIYGKLETKLRGMGICFFRM